MAASGCFGFTQEYAKYHGFDRDLWVLLAIKTTTANPRFGNPTPLRLKTPLVCLMQLVCKTLVSSCLGWKVTPWLKEIILIPIIANVAGFSKTRVCELSHKVFGKQLMSRALSSFSIFLCPNVDHCNNGLPYGQDPDLAYDVEWKAAVVSSLMCQFMSN